MKKHLFFFALLLLLGTQTKAQKLDTITATYIDTIHSRYISNNICVGGGCIYNLPVVIPPGFTIADIKYSFNYSTVGTCNLNQGGYIISLGSCKTFCNTCNIGLPGLCIGDGFNFAFYDSIKECLPAPNCVSDTINFVLDFFRDVQPGGGCGFSCVFGNGPWTISVIGSIDTCTASVIEHLNMNSVINISPNPATTQLTIHPVGWTSNGVNTSFNNEHATVSIMNVLGQETSPPAPLQRRGESASIDISALAAGVYFLQLRSAGGNVTKMFVKE